MIISFSKAILYHGEHIFSKHSVIVYPPIDTMYFKPLPLNRVIELVMDRFKWYRELVEAKKRDRTLLLYMGPVHPSRFPVSVVIKLLRLLKQQGLDPLLVTVTTIRLYVTSVLTIDTLLYGKAYLEG